MPSRLILFQKHFQGEEDILYVSKSSGQIDPNMAFRKPQSPELLKQDSMEVGLETMYQGWTPIINVYKNESLPIVGNNINY